MQRFLPNSAYAKKVITLMTGTSIAQAIPVAISPILTRLYTPDDFGVFALYMAMASIVSVLVTGRYELAVMLPRRDRDSINIVALAIFISFLFSVILLLIVSVFNRQITNMLGTPEVSNWLYLVPVSTLLTGTYQSMNYWNNRKGQYRRMAQSRILQSGGGAFTMVVAGYSLVGASGLVGGQIIGQALSTMLLGRIICQDDQSKLRGISRIRMVIMAKKYSAFPKYLILAHGFNTGSSQAPIIFLGSLFSSAIAGFYMMSQRVVGAPMTLIAGAIGDVFREDASLEYARYGNCKVIYLNALQRLLKISFVPFAVFFFVAPDLFSVVFGREWRISGEYAQILTPMFFLRFVTSPLSVMFLIAQRQRLDLLWQIILFTLVLLSFLFGYLQSSIHCALISLCVSYCFMYSLNGFVTFKLATGFKHW